MPSVPQRPSLNLPCSSSGSRPQLRRHKSEPSISFILPGLRFGRMCLSWRGRGRRSTLLLQNMEKLTVGQRIDEIGFGAYQVHAFIIACGAIMTEAAAVQTVSALVVALSSKFGVTSSMGEAMFMTCMFIGIQAGTAIAGPISDRFGRRMPVFVSYAGMIIMSVACYFAKNASEMHAFLVCFGCFAGTCIPTAMITMSEVMPSNLRGLTTGAMGIAFTAGSLWSAMGCWIFMPDLEAGAWRFMFLWTIFPAIAFFCFACVSRSTRSDSPSYLAVNGKTAEVVRAMNTIADMNRRPDLKVLNANTVRMEDATNGVTVGKACAILATTPLWFFFIIQALLFFSKEFVSAGTVAFWPLAWGSFKGGGLPHVSPAGELFITHLFRLPGVVLAMAILHFLPRRGALLLAAGSCVVSVLLMLLLVGGNAWQVGFLGVVLLQVAFPAWQMIVCLLPSEIFPTAVRGWAFSGSFFIGRFGSEVAQMVVHSSENAFLIWCASLGGFSMLLICLYPETKDCELIDVIDAKAEESTEGEHITSQKDFSAEYGTTREERSAK